MADVKHFVPELALARATDLFWRQGYAATSVQHLVDELGVNRSSLYATFGDKDALYAAALDRYCREEAGPRHALLAAPDRAALDGIAELLHGIAAAPREHPDRRGCLVVNAATERVPADPRTAEAVALQLERFEAALADALARGQAEGDVDDRHPPRALARFLVTLVQGMRVVGKAGRDDPTVLDDVVAVALSALRPPATG